MADRPADATRPGAPIPGPLLSRDGRVDTVVGVRVGDGLIAGLYAVRNPAKLSRVDRETVVIR
ncbi:hypothetical protein [Streptomyces sp. NPDC014006]|uniref:hypothetical protein n=1 Tax=Streptomyces sp. NPDC014006 TaxID=3364870 RepID=UPI0036FEF880